jgi:diguanylate cyclase (GGDEF)-like protein
VDYFKRFNDHYGHPAGDTCLCAVANALTKNCQRPADLAARYGGEEFVVLLPDVSLSGAQQVAQRILNAMDDLALPHASSAIANHVTVSIGIGFLDNVPRACTERDLIAAGDKALYAAKSAGRAQAWALDASHLATRDPHFICTSRDRTDLEQAQ